MSKGEIVKHIKGGKYLVKCELDMTAVNERVKALNKQIEKSNGLINNELQTAVNTARQALNAIDANATGALEKVTQARFALDKALLALSNQKLIRQNAVDEKGKLIDDFRIREFLLVATDTMVHTLMDDRFVALHVNDEQEEAIQIFRMENRVALPVVDDEGILLGIVTIDDMLWIANEEHTEDIQKIGGTEALDEPYPDIPLLVS